MSSRRAVGRGTSQFWGVLLTLWGTLCSVPDDYRCGKALGPVESLQGHLQDPTKILIGYSRGLLVIWSQDTHCVDHIFLGNQVSEQGLHAPHSGPLYTPIGSCHPILIRSSWRACVGGVVAAPLSAHTVMAAMPSGPQTLTTPQRCNPL